MEEVALADAVTSQGWAERNHVANDVFAVLWAATGTGHGVAVTVGAGELRRELTVGTPRLVPRTG